MCGICGVVSRDGVVDRQTVERMRDVMAHRGPDDAGLFLRPGIGLGHRRLSILDLSTGHQPLSNEDGSLWIVFNGEIYNYIELKETYLAGRHTFSTATDTEVILHLYEEFGEECVALLNGMFAFAIWDCRNQRLFLARDRVGVKPLYYTVRGDTLLFASEIKSLLQHDTVESRIDDRAVDEFVTFGFVQTPRTIFSGIQRLPEGHSLTWQHGRSSLKQYWDLKFEAADAIEEQEHVERVRALLQDAIRLRLRSDVPVGVLLSGGIDSSAVVALLAQARTQVKTFSVAFDSGPEYNECAHARRVAQAFGTDHSETVLTPRAFQDFIPRFINHMEEPVTEAAAIPLYFVSELASRQVKVVLSGEGSDEAFAGYPIYRYMMLMELYRSLPASARDAVERAARVGGRLLPKLDKYRHLASLPLDDRYLNVHLYDIRLRHSLYTGGFRERVGHDPLESIRDVYRHTVSWDALSRLLYLDTKTWLPNDILIKADRMSMAASIELRCPFLDYRLLEYAATIPSRWKLRGGRGKHILKEAMRGLLPKEIVNRKKMGFPTPLSIMFRGDLAKYVEAILLDRTTEQRGYFDPSAVRQMVRQHRSGAADHHSALWRLLILEEWQRQFIDASPRVSERAAHPSAATAACTCSSDRAARSHVNA